MIQMYSDSAAPEQTPDMDFIVILKWKLSVGVSCQCFMSLSRTPCALWCLRDASSFDKMAVLDALRMRMGRCDKHWEIKSLPSMWDLGRKEDRVLTCQLIQHIIIGHCIVFLTTKFCTFPGVYLFVLVSDFCCETFKRSRLISRFLIQCIALIMQALTSWAFPCLTTE